MKPPKSATGTNGCWWKQDEAVASSRQPWRIRVQGPVRMRREPHAPSRKSGPARHDPETRDASSDAAETVPSCGLPGHAVLLCRAERLPDCAYAAARRLGRRWREAMTGNHALRYRKRDHAAGPRNIHWTPK